MIVKGKDIHRKQTATIQKGEDGHHLADISTDVRFYKEVSTLNNPDIKVKVGIKAEIMSIDYPKRFTEEEVQRLVKKHLDSEECKLCERTVIEIIEQEIMGRRTGWERWGVSG